MDSCFAKGKRQTEYLTSLTSLRGFAAVFVMLFHIDVLTHYRGLGTLIPHSSTQFITKGYLWVDFFFVLSGFIVKHSYGHLFVNGVNARDIKVYLHSRFWRVYPLHLFTLLLLVPFVLLYPSFDPTVLEDDSWHTYFDWAAFVQSLFLINAHGLHSYLSWNMVSWSIGAEVWTYLLAIPFLFLFTKARFVVALCCGFVSFVLLVTLAVWHSNGSLDITYDYGVLRCFFGFGIGLALHRLYQFAGSHKALRADSLFVSISLMLMLGLHLGWADLIVAVLMSVLVLLGASNRGVVSSLLRLGLFHYLGKISYSIYLLHGVVFMVFWYAVPTIARYFDIQTFTLAQQLLVWSLFVGCTLFLASLTFRCIEVPFRKGFKASVVELSGSIDTRSKNQI